MTALQTTGDRAYVLPRLSLVKHPFSYGSMVLFSKYKESLAISNRQEAQVTAYKLQFDEAWGL